ncbi:flagellar protein FliO/FliZ [Scopulibacillus daqui]|uniref:Flagellar protein FliO/FliZ n=2 Tax=Scopulibacillus daqui TaxID=1469162 RepID=A0ABS2PWF1_9BACL|nr:flagellar protein FliO/FliZ [Scopulibacillus daqui]
MMRIKLLACVFLIVLCYGPGMMAKAETSGDSQTVEEAIKQGEHHGKAEVGQENNVGSKQQQNLPSSRSNLIVVFLKLLGALAVVIALIYFLYKVLGKRTKAFQEYGAIKNIGGVSVGPNRSVQLVRVGSKILVIGVGENVQLLKEVTDEPKVEELLKKADEPDPIQVNMKKMLNWTVDKTKKDHNKQEMQNDFNSVLKRQLEPIRKDWSNQIDKAIREERNHE